MSLVIPVETVLERPPPEAGQKIGTSRQGRDLIGHRIGRGPLHVSLIGGCHADEPVGPAMLDCLAAYLHGLAATAPLLSEVSWWIVPHVNPDGEAANAGWTGQRRPHPGGGTAYDLAFYLRHVVREPPGDDVEFGFPRHDGDVEARPENRAVADFLRPGAPFGLHGSFHGMAFAAGPWFLMEASWADRTVEMRHRLRSRVAGLGYIVHDIDRRGEKGFHRIDEGFTTRPDSRAMAAYFEELSDPETARLFRPSSMEYVGSLGGDPLTLVSEMPLFLLPAECYLEGDLISPPALNRLRSVSDAAALAGEAREIGLAAMAIEDQMRLQLAFIEEALESVATQKS